MSSPVVSPLVAAATPSAVVAMADTAPLAPAADKTPAADGDKALPAPAPAPAPAVPAPAGPPDWPWRRWIVLAISCVGVFLASVSTSALIIAFPKLIIELHTQLSSCCS